MAKIIPQKAKDEAVRLVTAGQSLREAAAQISKRFRIKVNESSIRRWRALAEAQTTADEDESQPSSAPPPVDPPAPAAEEDPDDGANEDLLVQTRRMLRNAQRLAAQASADGNHAAAQKHSRDAAGLVNTIARIEAGRKSGEERLFTRDELEKARASITERVTKLAQDVERTGGLVCSHCGREVRIMLAKGE